MDTTAQQIKSKLAENPILQACALYPWKAKAELCRRSFYTFVQEFWDVIIREDPVYNWHIEYLCHEAEKVAWRVIAGLPKEYDLIINIPPGTTKSTIFTQMLPAWIWIARLPDEVFDEAIRCGRVPPPPGSTGNFIRTISGSYSAALSLEHAEYSRDIIRSDKYRLYFPEITIKADKDQKSNYKNTSGGQRFSTSVGGTVTGNHGHLLIIDDPLNPKQAASETELHNANDWMSRTLPTRKVNKEVTVTILIMQRLDHKDCTADMLRKKGKRIRHIVLPASLDYEVKPASLAENYIDGLLDPVRMPVSVLEEARADLTPLIYAGQFGQSPKPREGGMFPRIKFRVVAAAPSGGTQWVRGWDLAATSEFEAKQKKTNPAYTAGVKMKFANGKYYIGHVVRTRGTPGQVKTAMYNTATQDGENTLIDFPQDPGQAGKAQAQDLAANLSGFNVRYSVESGDKVLRAAPFSAQVEADNVCIVEGGWNEDFLNEADFFPNGFKDQIDAAVRAFTRLVSMTKKKHGTVGAPAGVSSVRNFNPEAEAA